MKKIKVFEAFSGYGSQRMALENLGINHEVVAISEIDKFAIKSYEAIHGKTLNLGDISQIETDQVPDHDLFTYSFPCQDISIAGERLGLDREEGTRSGLLWECERIINAKKPKYLLMENVKNLVGKKFMPDFQEWINYLESIGYTNYWKVLNAKDYGVPQNRERVFMVSVYGSHEPYVFPETETLVKRLKDVLEDEVEEKFYLSDERIGNIIFRKKGQTNVIANGDASSYEQNNRIYDIDMEAPTITARDYKDPKRILEPEIIKEFDIPKEVLNDNERQRRVYNTGGISPTILARSDSSKITTNFRIRKLTPLECWRLMGVTDENFFKAQAVNSNTQLYKQAGNSIVVPVMEAIFKNLFKGGE